MHKIFNVIQEFLMNRKDKFSAFVTTRIESDFFPVHNKIKGRRTGIIQL